ncbi:hypothetical protein OHT76_15445 [Streptomyces sp. NBC_00287]|uniref:hypothetical protein n=1 Tax=Streptomyces sp. NBC_00287 TaxID=2975702 RepID=UPI002E29B1A8|nr:hypothetical protein [Streptomyces sp. NBC_00287]
MPDYIYCPNCPKGKAHPFRRVNKTEQAYISSKRGKKDAPGYFRCEGKTSKGQCLWVQPRWNQGKGFSLPEDFS